MPKEILETGQRMSDKEFFAKMDAMKSTKTKQMIHNYSGESADEEFTKAIKKALLAELEDGED